MKINGTAARSRTKNDKELRINKFRAAVEELCQMIRKWADEDISNGTVIVEDKEILIWREELLGNYQINSITLKVAGGRCYDFTPKASKVTGADGKVIASCGSNECILVWNNGSWCLAQKGITPHFTPLNEPAFRKMLSDLANESISKKKCETGLLRGGAEDGSSRYAR